MSWSKRATLAFGLCALLALAASPAALAADPVGPTFVEPASQTVPPQGFRISARTALRLARATPEVKQALARHPGLQGFVFFGSGGHWAVTWFTTSGTGRRSGPTDEVVEVAVDGVTGAVSHVWTGIKAYDFLARGHFGRKADAPWVWIPLCLAFVAPFFDLRRPLRILHLDLLVLLSFGISQIFYTAGHPFISVPLVYPVLGYLLVRMLMVGLRPRRRREPLVPHAPWKLLAIGLVLLVAFRIAINVSSDKVIDVGYASVVGAHRIMHNQPLYVISPYHGDTYGPANYVAYVPFEQLFHWKGRWDSVPAAHAAAITFDLLAILGLFLLGRRLRGGLPGRRLGLALAFAWAAYPYTLYPLALNSNDTLIAMLLVYALLAITSPAARAALVALAGAAKFAPLALLPLVAAGGREKQPRKAILVAGASALAVLAVSLFAYVPVDHLPIFWRDTLGFQLSRSSNFSLWSQYPALGALRIALVVSAAGLALAVAFLPRRRETYQVAALGAAILIAIELLAKYWFYFYVVWIAPLVLVALLTTRETAPRRAEPDEIETAAIVGTPRDIETVAAP